MPIGLQLSRMTPVRFVAVLLAAIFVAEAGIMFVLPLIVSTHASRSVAAGADAFLLVVILAPVLWWMVIHPLQSDAVGEQQRVTRLVAILEATPDLVSIASPEGRLFYLNRAGRKMVGMDEQADVGGHNLREFHAADAHVVSTGLPTAIQEGAWSGDTEVVALDGHATAVSQVILAHKAPNGTVAFLSTVARDITARRRAEDELRRMSTRLAVVLDNITDGFFTLDRELRYTDVNISGATMVGRTREQLIGRRLLDEFPQAADTAFVRAFQRVSKTGEACVVEDYYAPLDRWFEARLYPSPGGLSVIFSDVSERRRSEQALRASQAQLQLISDNVLDLVAQISLDGSFVYVSPSYETVLGYTPQRLIGTSAFASIHPEDMERVQIAFTDAIQRGTGRAEFRYRHADGRYIWVDAHGKVFFDEAGAPVGSVLSSRDITERKQLEEQRELLAAIVEASPDFIGFADSNAADIRYINKGGRKMCGIGEDEDIRKLKISDVHPEWMNKRLTELILPAARRDGSWEGDGAFLHRDGREIPVSMALLTRKGPTGEVDLFFTVSRDITERKRSEELLRRSLALLDRTGQVAKIGGWELDLDTQTLTWTAEVYRIREVDPAVTPTVADAIQFYAPEGRPVIAAAIQAASDAGTPFDLVLPMITARGRHIFIRALGTAERLDGRTTRLYGAIQDITEARAADESRRLKSAALNAAADGVLITDRAGAIAWVNPAFTELTGYTVEEAIGRNPRDLVKSGKHGQAFYKDVWDTILAGRTWNGEMINRKKDGSLYTEQQSITPILDASGAITHFVAIKKDMTEQLQLEAQYRQAQKMESVGQLASGIAHDFNNLLTVINGLSDFLLAQVSHDDPMRGDVQEILRAGERAATLTRQLLAFSRQQILELRVLNLNTVVTGMETLLRRLLREDIDLVLVPMPGLGNVKGDPGQLEQVIVNLVVNARDAMPRGGQLTIETQNVTVDKGVTRQIGATMPPGSYVLLAVSDTGVGMDEATRARIFEPFFTTKGPGKGTGLGLSTVYGIVNQSHGFIWVYSEIGRGTSFKIYLPQVTDAAGADQPTPTVVSTSGTETILLVEDSDGLRKLATRLLARAGYTVLEAVSSEEALGLLEHHGAPVQLLLSDVVLPGMNGRELAEQLARTRPGMKVLYMSGYTSDTIVRHGVLEAEMSFLNKPFTAAGLLRKVREVLDSQ